MWAPEPAWTQWRREESASPYRESNSVRQTRSLVTILTELPPLVQTLVNSISHHL